MQPRKSRSAWSRRDTLEGLMLAAALVPMRARGATLAEDAGQQGAPDGRNPSTAASSATAAVGIPGVVAAGTRAEFLRGGFHGTEGVIRAPDGSVLFCEQEENRVHRIDHNGTFEIYLENTNRSIGLAFDHQGRLISTQTRAPRIGVLAPERLTLADSFEGQPLVRPNDLVVDRRGGIYFSDPITSSGTANFHDPAPGRKPLMLYLRPDGSLTRSTGAIREPHKLTLSPDEKTFYATDGDHVVAFDVQRDGTLANARRFAELTAEALVVDETGRLYASTDTAIEVFSTAGMRLGAIPTPLHFQNFAFAGEDRRTLVGVGKGNVYRMAMLARGIAVRQK